MSFMKTNSVDITVSGTTYNSLTDFGLAINNTDYIGTPVQDTSNRIYVPGRNGYLDLTETVFGSQWFQYRPIEITFGGIRTTSEWDSVISDFRNLFEGKICKITFANDPDWYWTGRVVIDAFSHKRQLGTFDFMMPEAMPFKYQDISIDITSSDVPIMYYLPNKAGTIVPKITTDANLVVYGKNIIHYPYDSTSASSRGIDFTVNSDGSVDYTGIPNHSATGLIELYEGQLLKAGSYTLSGGSDQYAGATLFFYDDANCSTKYSGNSSGLISSSSSVYVFTSENGYGGTATNNYGYDKDFTIESDAYISVMVRSVNNTVSVTISGTVYPMLRLASATNAETGAAYTGTTSDYEPYTTYSFDAGTTSATDMEFGSEGKFITLTSASDVTIDYSEESL